LRKKLSYEIGLEIKEKLEKNRKTVVEEDDESASLPSLLLWGMAMIQSRIHTVPHIVSQSRNKREWKNVKMLVPFADALNTNGNPNVDCYTNELSTLFVCSANRRILPNIQLTSHYGGSNEHNKGRGMYAINYGFIDNTWMKLNEYVWIDIDIDGGGGGGGGGDGRNSSDGVKTRKSVAVHDGQSLENLRKEYRTNWNGIVNSIHRELILLHDSINYNHDDQGRKTKNIIDTEVTTTTTTIVNNTIESNKMKARLGALVREAEIETLHHLLHYANLQKMKQVE